MGESQLALLERFSRPSSARPGNVTNHILKEKASGDSEWLSSRGSLHGCEQTPQYDSQFFVARAPTLAMGIAALGPLLAETQSIALDLCASQKLYRCGPFCTPALRRIVIRNRRTFCTVMCGAEPGRWNWLTLTLLKTCTRSANTCGAALIFWHHQFAFSPRGWFESSNGHRQLEVKDRHRMALAARCTNADVWHADWTWLCRVTRLGSLLRKSCANCLICD